MRDKSNRDYTGKTVFIGIDVHKRTFSLVALCEGVIVKKWSMSSEVSKCVGQVIKYFSGAKILSVYEAGFSGYSLHRALIEAGIENIVINPSSVQKASNDRVKTDLLDAKKMALQLSQGLLRGIEVPSRERELQREVCRMRSQLVEHRVAVGLQIKSKLLYYGLMLPTDHRKLSEKYFKELEVLDIESEIKISFKILMDLWRDLTKKIKELESELEKQEENDPKVTRIYRSVPGVGLITSRILATELGDLNKRFRNERELFSYTGLTPSEYSSGDRVHKGRITRCGSSKIRWILTEAAWLCIRKDEAMREVYERIKQKRGSKKAIIAVARKLIGRIRSCFVQGCEYQLGMI